MKVRNASVALVALFTAACGGGGGGGGVSENGGPQIHPIQDLSTIRSKIEGEQLDLSSQEIRNSIAERTATANSLISTDVVDSTGKKLATIVCEGSNCQVFGSDFEISGVVLPDTEFVPIATRDGAFNISDIAFSNTEFVPVMKRHGVNIVQGTEINRFSETSPSSQQQSITSSGWTEHSVFYVDASAFEFAVDQDLRGRQSYHAGVSIGYATGTRPVSGTATWKGVVVAGDYVQRELHQGDATLTANFGASNIDVRLTGFYDVETGAERDSIVFDEVPFTSDGFRDSAVNKMIEGKFYGPNHAEAGGVFEHGSRFGAFGAIRQ
ncbi:MAG: hypothetical protein OXI87_06245 [Albidovulum sp.]|nr:hypothetical protein [Albidovulum sp.]MDE0533388.1 hypothetical protein [Albidovulum sp.]